MVDSVVDFSPLAAALLAMAALCAWVFIHSNRAYRLRWAVIPFAMLAAVFTARLYDARLGFAAPAELPEKFVYLGHHVVVIQNEKAGIEVWGQTRSTRLYRLPYSKPMERAMDEAKAAGKGGAPVVMHRSHAGAPGEPGKPGSEDLAPYESNIILPSDVDPKT